MATKKARRVRKKTAKKKTTKRATKTKKKDLEPQSQRGGPGRPSIMEEAVSRSVLLDSSEWSQISALLPNASYSSKIRALMRAAGLKPLDA